jgi:hypothetical protein
VANATNFLDWAESWYSAIRWATASVGRRVVGYTHGVMANAVVEGANQARYAGLPGHPEQSPDAADQVGAARDLFRFRLESNAAWAARVADAWAQYELGGTAQGVIRAVGEWLTAIGGTPPATLTEDSWARFSVYLPFGSVPWAPPYDWDGVATYGQIDCLYNLRANAIDVDHLRRLVRKWKPVRSKGLVRIPLVAMLFYGGGATFGGGGAYAGVGDLVEFDVW